MKLVVMKKGGEAGQVAINPDLVTHVRSMAGPYTDIYFRDHRVAVEGSFAYVVERLMMGDDPRPSQSQPRQWINTG